MPEIILLLLLTAAGAYTFVRSPDKAFLDIYLPVLIMIPPIFHGRLFILPELSTSQITIIPIFIMALLLSFSRWKFVLLDLLVCLFIFTKVISEYYNWGSKEAINVLAVNLCNVWAPYSLAKLYLIPNQNLIKFSKRLVFLFFILVVFSAWEFFKLGNLFVLIPQRFLFSGQGYEWGTLYRYGFVRISASFVQPILFAMGLSIALFLNYWICKEKLWTKSFSYLPLPSFLRKSYILTVTLIIGLLATSSRGPQLATLVGFCFVGVGHAKARVRSLFKRLFFLGMVSLMGYIGLQSYFNANKEMASEGQSTVIYRMELLENYYDIVMQKPYLGWGRTGVPIIKGQKSVDNEYLSSALSNGIFIPALEILMFVYIIFRLLRRGLKDKGDQNDDSTLAFVLIGIFFTLSLSLATVYMGLQIEPLVFMMLGLSQGYLLSNPKDFYKNQVESYRIKYQYTKLKAG